ncbi:hypothetical protein [Clostridium sp. C105KSO13]|uniref:hypothetical protein n=1 Tax=Clostridium sp. C105KSO13 TaxID=1776045 RepID=UPI0007408937|nr:hypothetical protein [Clostridium sp. C105KSO13]CUX48711.1 hypothetical protein BN3456_02787 [Clostridium sp. C105KSO13]
MKKFLKWFISLATVGTAIGLIIAYFCKSRSDECSCGDSQDLTEDEDFDLDSDLQPVRDREYVPLKKTTDNTSADGAGETPDGAVSDEEKSPSIEIK